MEQGLRKMITKKQALAIETMTEGRTTNTVKRANVLPSKIERQAILQINVAKE